MPRWLHGIFIRTDRQILFFATAGAGGLSMPCFMCEGFNQSEWSHPIDAQSGD